MLRLARGTCWRWRPIRLATVLLVIDALEGVAVLPCHRRLLLVVAVDADLGPGPVNELLDSRHRSSPTVQLFERHLLDLQGALGHANWEASCEQSNRSAL